MSIVTDEVAWSVCRFVFRSVTVTGPAKTVEAIDMLLGLCTRVGARKQACGAHWRNVVNTIEPSLCVRVRVQSYLKLL